MDELVAPMHVLMLLEGHFPSMGGAERQLEAVSRGLQARGHQVTLVLPQMDHSQPAGASQLDGLDLWRIGYPAVPLFGSLLLMIRLAWLLWRWRQRYAAIHVHIAHNMGAVAALMGRLLGKPVVLKFSGWWELERGSLRRDGGLSTRVARLLLRRASAVQAISQHIARELVVQGFEQQRIHWIPNGVVTDRFEHIARPKPMALPPTVVFVGRLVAEKGLTCLLRAWREAGLDVGPWRLRLVGGGWQEDELRALCSELGLDHCVDFVGASSEVERHLAEADVGVLPSRAEGLSNTLLEYMAAGLPVIATRISGSEDFVVTGRNGWLCEPGDVEGLAAALRAATELADAERLALGTQARADLIERASLPAVLSGLTQLYAGRVPAGAH